MIKFTKTGLILLGCLLTTACVTQTGIRSDTTLPDKVIPDWSVPSPLHPVPATAITNPILTAADVTDAGDAEFVADPFLYFDGKVWHLFFEVFRTGMHKGVISHAVSPDGFHWKYDRIVLSAPWHLSYPQVFSANNHYYMIPEARKSGKVILYEARNFPYNWTPVASFQLKGLLDPSVVYHDGLWWMFVSDSNFNLFLYYSNNLLAGWTEHPRSPLTSDRAIARCGGRTFVWGNSIIRIAQESTDTEYGVSVRAFRLKRLTKTTYEEYEIAESPLLRGSGTGWNAKGMHHYDPWFFGDRWIIAADGWGDGIFAPWSIGIFTSQ